jgi:hypothetical protein
MVDQAKKEQAQKLEDALNNLKTQFRSLFKQEITGYTNQRSNTQDVK